MEDWRGMETSFRIETKFYPLGKTKLSLIQEVAKIEPVFFDEYEFILMNCIVRKSVTNEKYYGIGIGNLVAADLLQPDNRGRKSGRDVKYTKKCVS
jgi:hypothetical protein